MTRDRYTRAQLRGFNLAQLATVALLQGVEVPIGASRSALVELILAAQRS